MKRMRFLRKLLPGWHAREKAFRKWYIGLVNQFNYKNKFEYDAYVQAFEAPEEVRGYREIRYPKMETAIKKVESILKGQGPEPMPSDSLHIET